MAQTLLNCKLLVHLNALAPLEQRSTFAVVRVVRMTEEKSLLADVVLTERVTKETGKTGKSPDSDTEGNLFECIHMNELEKVVVPVGFEPTTNDLKGRCSTVELKHQLVGGEGFEPPLKGL